MKKLLLSLAVVAGCSLAANADYYLVGGFNGWSNPGNYAFTEGSDGNYTLDLPTTLTTGFKVTNGTWANDGTWGGPAETKLVVGETYTLSQPGENIEIEGNIENPHLVFNPTEGTLLIAGEEVEAFYIYGIHGSIFTGSDWMTVNMTEDTDNGVWFMEKTDFVVGEFGIKQMDADSGSQTGWISAASDNEVVIGAVMNCAVEGAGGNFKLNTPGSYSVVYDPKAMTLVFSEEDYNSVKALNTDNGEEVIYNLQGVRVNKANAAPGIYIVNGKKTVLR